MALFGGGSASASQTLTNAITYTPILNIGENNDSDLTNSLENRASAEALNKDEVTASVGVGLGGSGSGGAVMKGDTEGGIGVFDTAKSAITKDNSILFGVGGVVVGGVVLYFFNRK